MQQDKKISKKRGRPPTGTSKTVGVRVRPELSAEIEGWRAQQRPIPSQPEAIRRLVELGLRAPPPKKGPDQTTKDSDGRIIPPAAGLKAKGK
jgi:hypothetical protein